MIFVVYADTIRNKALSGGSEERKVPVAINGKPVEFKSSQFGGDGLIYDAQRLISADAEGGPLERTVRCFLMLVC